MKKITILLILLLAGLAVYGREPSQRGATMKLRITIQDTVLTATVYDNPTARDFVTLLPLTLELKDYASTEKVSDLPRKLSLEGAPRGSDPLVGDITYYAPWGNLALFYRDFRYADGLVKLARLDGGVDLFARCKEPCKVKFEAASK